MKSDTFWWAPGAIVACIGLGLVALGVFDHDNQALMGPGLITIGSAGGFLVGKQSPVP